MNIAKNMEAIFVVALALFGLASLATATAATTAAHPAALLGARDAAPMQVVTISAKRLSAAEKAQLAH